jgi:hypothetical protein
VSSPPGAAPVASPPRARSLLGRLAATFRFWSDPTIRPLPQVQADLGGWVPAWLVTLLVAGLAVGGAALVVGGVIGWLVMGGILGTLVLFPEGPSTGIYAIAIGVLLLLSGAEPFAGRVFVLIALVHLVAVLDSVASGLPWRTRLQLSALRDPLRRYLGVQVVAQALALLGALLTGAELTLAWLPVVAAVGLAVLSWVLDARLDARGRPEHRVR